VSVASGTPQVDHTATMAFQCTFFMEPSCTTPSLTPIRAMVCRKRYDMDVSFLTREAFQTLKATLEIVSTYLNTTLELSLPCPRLLQITNHIHV
jgi:hypothetical protein